MGCRALSKKYYSYVWVMSAVDSVKTPQTYSHLISYGNYIFEFNIRINREEIRHRGNPNYIPKLKITGYDTLSVYLLNGKTRLFYEFDTFALKTKLIKIAKWEDKPTGQDLHLSPAEPKSNFLYGPLKQELINNIPCFVSKITRVKDPQSDSLSCEEIFVKDVDLNSFFKICGTKFTDNNYCLVGYRVFYPKKKEGTSIEIENLRPLNEREIAICKTMVQIMGTAVTDTLGNYQK
jgi:hypothetical protein